MLCLTAFRNTKWLAWLDKACWSYRRQSPVRQSPLAVRWTAKRFSDDL